MKKNLPGILSAVLLATGLAFMAAGVLRDEAMTVLRKAIMICLECIGLG